MSCWLGDSVVVVVVAGCCALMVARVEDVAPGSEWWLWAGRQHREATGAWWYFTGFGAGLSEFSATGG